MADILPAKVWSPVVTPFAADLSIDSARLEEHCQWSVDRHCGLALFGTNSEAVSLTSTERMDTLDRLIDAGLPPGWMMPGIGGCALPDVVALARECSARGVAGVLTLPPFYYKGVSDDGLFGFFAELIERTGDARLRLYLYHIPVVTGVPLSIALIERLLARYPGIVAGIKDSEGSADHTRRLVDTSPDWNVLPGNETYLADAVAFGVRGCISATCNVNPGAIVELFDRAQSDDARMLQDRCNAVRAAVGSFPMIAALKAVLATGRDDPAWRRVRPPLVALSPNEAARLHRDLDALGFTLDTGAGQTVR